MAMFKIAFRNIFRQKRRSLLTSLTIFGGLALATISIGWADGSYNFIINMFTRNELGHIQIHFGNYRKRPSLYKTINNYKQIGEKLDNLKGIESWSPRLYSAGLVSVNDNSSGAQIIGIDPIREERATRFDKKIIKGNYFFPTASHTAILGKGLAKVLNADTGDDIVIVSQGADGSIANDIYKIIGIMKSDNEIGDRMSIYLNLADAQDLLVLPNQIHEMAVIVGKLTDVKKLTNQIEKLLQNSNLEVSPWQVFAKSFYQAMKADKEGMWIMLFVIMLIVAIGVLNTVLMSVLERQREYGVLKAVGTRPFDIFWLVIQEVIILSVFSICIGAALGTLTNYFLSFHGITLPQSFSYGGMEFKKMYTEVNIRSIIIPTITVIFSATVISFFPALKAAHTEPAKTMRIH
jgi:putative ABC transport system permease protein